MDQKRALWLVVGVFVVLAAIAVGVVLLLQTGVVSVIPSPSSGQVDEAQGSSGVVQPVGYVGVIVPGRSTTGALSEGLLDAHKGPPDLIIPGGTPVKVTTSHAKAAEVEILEGSERGMKPWIHWEDLK
ncbi:MAG: hypothetical protein ACHQ50_11110 [Fimbriimonadales bacterium]